MSTRSTVFASDIALRITGGRRRTFGGWLHTVAYGVWLGGLIAIGAFVAPNVAELIHSNSAFAGNVPLQRDILIGIIGSSFRLFNVACYICGACMVAGDILQAAASDPGYKRFTYARTFFTLVLLGSALFLGYVLFPQMDVAQAAGRISRFDLLHKQYELISELQLIPLLIIPAISAQRERALGAIF